MQRQKSRLSFSAQFIQAEFRAKLGKSFVQRHESARLDILVSYR
jgi:hypothetical protein